jgi:thioredoxin-like negative regulator of GroEL
MVHGLEAEYWGKIDFVYLNIDDPATEAIQQEYGFTAQPLFILIEPDGSEVTRWFGYNPEQDFRAAFDAYLATSSGG